MLVNQITIGRFHHFHLARQLERHGLLGNIFTGYPKFKLLEETGIDPTKIKSFPWLHAPFMASLRFGLNRWEWLKKEWEWIDYEVLDKYVASKLSKPSITIALSGCGLHTGKKIQSIGGRHVCDRGSAHIGFQNTLLDEEYSLWGAQFKGIDKRFIDKELLEYNQADLITVPSEFAKKSFIENGIDSSKIHKIPYGARLERFYKIPVTKANKFVVLWVGAISFQKGFLYALEAFTNLKYSNKEFVVVGIIEPQLEALVKKQKSNNVTFKGNVPNYKLLELYNSANVFVLPSIQEGFGMVLGEAMACGCPVIASTNTGAFDLYTDKKEGFIVPIRSSISILEKFEMLLENRQLQEEMSHNSIKKVKSLGGWEHYGDEMIKVLNTLNKN